MVALAACGLVTSCSTAVWGFHPVHNPSFASRVVPNEEQIGSGPNTFVANDTSNPADLRWVVTTGPDAAHADATPVTTLDRNTVLQVSLDVAPKTKAYYRICLVSIASPSSMSCQVYAVGDFGLWNGHWAGTTVPVGLTGTQSGTEVTLTLTSPLQGELPPRTITIAEPFQVAYHDQGGPDVWLEWGPGDVITYSSDGAVTTLAPAP